LDDAAHDSEARPQRVGRVLNSGPKEQFLHKQVYSPAGPQRANGRAARAETTSIAGGRVRDFDNVTFCSGHAVAEWLKRRTQICSSLPHRKSMGERGEYFGRVFGRSNDSAYLLTARPELPK
jgi:hypothetical protein